MKKRKRIGLFTEGTITIQACSEAARQREVEKESFSITLLTALWNCCGITFLLVGNLLDICLVWKLDWKNIWVIFFVLMSAGAVLLAKLSKHHRFVHLVAAFVLLFVGVVMQKELLNGCYVVTNAFVFSLNQYYGTRLHLFSAVLASGWEITVLYLVAWMSLYLSYFHGKKASRLGTVLINLLPVALGLLVGRAPNYVAFTCMLIGSIFLLAGMTSRKIDNNRTAMCIIGKNYLLAGGVFLIVAIVYALAGTRVEGMLSKHHDQMLSYQKKLEQQIQNANFNNASTLQDGVISNQKVIYTGKEIIRVTVVKKPDSILYFRGFVGDTYKGGIWSPVDEDAFQKEMDVWTPTPEKGAGSFILNYSYQLQAASSTLEAENSMKIAYADSSGEYAYIPYYANIRNPAVYNKIYVEADAQIYRRMTSDSVQVNMFSPQKTIREMPISVLNDELWQNYSPYAMKHYTQITSEGLDRLVKLGDSWRAEGDAAKDGFKEGDTAYDIPIARVREELNQTTNYSRNLNAVPEGEDVVENFLFDSREGYCIHYASAATLLLRYLGVPARYVEGYAVKPQEFQKNDDGTYTATVPDYDGHAWAEVYNCVRGWIPIEVTKGTIGSGYEKNTPNTDASTIASEQAKNANANNTIPDTAQTKKTTQQGQKKHISGRKSLIWKPNLKVVIQLLLLTTAIAGGVYLLWIKTNSFRKMIRIRRHFSNHDTRKAVLAFSYAIYQQLLRAGVIMDKHIWDDDYAQILKEKLTFLNQDDLSRFFDLAKKTSFSQYQPSEDEVEETRVLYQKIIQAIQDGRISK